MITLVRPQGPRLRQLTLARQRDLDLLLSVFLADGSWRDARLPVEYSRAFAELARRRGVPVRVVGYERQVSVEVPLGRNVPGCVGGSHRRVVASGRERLAGGGVEPWNVREWRE